MRALSCASGSSAEVANTFPRSQPDGRVPVKLFTAPRLGLDRVEADEGLGALRPSATPSGGREADGRALGGLAERVPRRS